MKDCPKLSVFIPVFNAEKYLDQCLTSVLNQTYSNLEIVLYDDGSSDGSYDICRKYANLDARIVFRHNQNGFSIFEQNRFLREASGEYLACVDNDDYLEEHYFERIMEKLLQSKADCAITPYSCVDEVGNPIKWKLGTLEDGKVVTSQECLKEFLTTINIEGFRWNKVYRKDVVGTMEYIGGGFSDIPGSFQLISQCKSIVYVAYPHYYYRQRATSDVAISALQAKRTTIMLNRFIEIRKSAEQHGLYSEGEFYQVWRVIRALYSRIKDRKRFSVEGWNEMKEACTWNRWLPCGPLKVIRILARYEKGTEFIKMAIKTLIVFAVLGNN